MSDALQSLLAMNPHYNPAIAQCSEAWRSAFDAALVDLPNDGAITAQQLADQAFRSALPPLAGQQNIRDFVACVTHGIVNDILTADEGQRLLYAAQVAISAHGSTRARRGRPRKM